jgi:hypothetical protein
MNFCKPKEYFVGNGHLHKKSLGFYTNITFWEIQRYFWTPFFKNLPDLSSKKISWTTVDKPLHQFNLEIRFDLLLEYLKHENIYCETSEK